MPPRPQTDGLFATHKVATEVGSINPVEDFNSMVDSGRADLVAKAMGEMQQQLRSMVKHDASYHAKALRCLKVVHACATRRHLCCGHGVHRGSLDAVVQPAHRRSRQLWLVPWRQWWFVVVVVVGRLIAGFAREGSGRAG